MPLIRYPGSKAKIAEKIISAFPIEIAEPLWANAACWQYREPFFGAGAVGFRVLPKLPANTHIWLNDIDYGLVCLWQAVAYAPEELIAYITNFQPSVSAYEQYKLGVKHGDPVLTGFQKLALHQMSYSGLGAKSGGPLGGKDQENAKYAVNCRWNPVSLTRDVNQLHKILNRFRYLKITCRDFAQVIHPDNSRIFYYLDPPYYDKGPELYLHAFSEMDHSRLSDLLHKTTGRWVLSYDDHPTIRQLYNGFSLENVTATYTIANRKGAGQHTRKNHEVLIKRCHVNS